MPAAFFLRVILFVYILIQHMFHYDMVSIILESERTIWIVLLTLYGGNAMLFFGLEYFFRQVEKENTVAILDTSVKKTSVTVYIEEIGELINASEESSHTSVELV